MTACKNCQASYDGAYCPQCGQRNVDFERPISALVGELVKETFDVDGRAFRTIRTLFLRPGVLTREYLAGRRRYYTSPLRLYLVISVVCFLLFAWLAGKGILLAPDQTLEADAAGQAQFASETMPKLMFVLLPIFALLLKSVYPGRLYFDHLIYSLHLHSAMYVMLVILLLFEETSNTNWLSLGVQIVLLVYLLAYLILSARRVYGSSPVIAGAKSIAILIGYLIAVSGAIRLSDVVNRII